MRLVSAALFFLLMVSVFVACNKEKSFEVAAPAKGSLKNDGTGDCLPKTVGGAFIAGTTLTDSNYMELDVDVATKGGYEIHTDTVNGYSFSGIGNFSHTGINHIRLAASGKPVLAQQDEFTVIFDTSFCFVPVSVLPAGSNGPAVFTLQGSGDTCMIAAVSGAYIQNTPLGAANTVAIKVNVATPGTYTISTNAVNDFSFTGTGTLAATGEQTITLQASGTPTVEGATVFTITAGTTTCNFTVNVQPSGTLPPPTGDLFPLTNNSYWTYSDDQGAPEDSTVVTNRGSVTITGVPNTYSFFEIADGDGTVTDTALYRKAGNDYYTYIPADLFSSFTFDEQQWGDVLFLKEGLQTGTKWTSAEFSGTMQNQPLKIRYQFECTAANTSTVVNGISYASVYKIVCTPEASSSGSAFVNAGEKIDFYYAKGIGLLYEKGSLNSTVVYETSLLHYKVF